MFDQDGLIESILSRYMIRNPFALAKMTYDDKTAMVIYRSKFHASLKRNYQLLQD